MVSLFVGLYFENIHGSNGNELFYTIKKEWEMFNIENIDLKQKLQGICNKKIEEIQEEDLETIKDITINAKDNIGNIISNNLKDLTYFKNLEYCTIKDYEITKENFETLYQLKTIENLEFISCAFIDKSEIKLKLKQLRFSFCNGFDVGEIFGESRIENIIFNNCDDFTLKNINKIMGLETIELNEIKLDKKKINALLECKAKNIVFNNCQVNLLYRAKIKELEARKNLKIMNQKLVL